jgi:hypothetical protein
MLVRILRTPPGEAPLVVREAWVGLVLPGRPGEVGPRTVLTAGILTGPRSLVGFVIAYLRRRFQRVEGFLVDAAGAVAVLEGHDASAASWWRENAPSAVAPGRVFVFHAEVCELVRELPSPSGDPGDADPGGPYTRELR